MAVSTGAPLQSPNDDPESVLAAEESSLLLHDNENKKNGTKNLVDRSTKVMSWTGLLLCILATSIVSILIGYLLGSSHKRIEAMSCLAVQSDESEISKQQMPFPHVGSERHWILAELSTAETISIAEFVTTVLDNVQTSGTAASLNDESINGGDFLSGADAVSLYPVPKAQALEYINGDTENPPPRFARVTVVRGSKGDVMEYKVGPIHGCDVGDCHTNISVGGLDGECKGIDCLTPLLKPGQVPWAKRPTDFSDTTQDKLITETVKPLLPILEKLMGPIFEPLVCGTECDPSALEVVDKYGFAFPFGFNHVLSNSTNRILRIGFVWFRDPNEFQAAFLHPLPFSFIMDQGNGKPSQYKAYDIHLCMRGPFATPDDVLKAVKANPSKFECDVRDLLKDTGRKPGDWDIPGAASDQHGRWSPDGSMAARLVSSPSGIPRYTLSTAGVDESSVGRYVEWQGWKFFTTVRPSTGLVAYDIHFKDKSVAYELALSEAAAFYSGDVVNGEQVYWLDSAFSMSQLAGNMLRGVDCPWDATYLDLASVPYSFVDGQPVFDVMESKPVTSVCVFEDDHGSSLWRHTQLMSRKTDGVRNTDLVLRHAASVGNYDYITEFRFGLDGSITVNFNFAGYCETRYYDANVNPQEGPRDHFGLSEIVKTHLAAPLHSHIAAFKVDLDVLGEANSFERLHLRTGSIPDVEGTDVIPSKYIDTETVSHEGIGVSTSVVDPRNPTIYRIINKDVDGPGGDNRQSRSRHPGYAIVPGPTVVNTLPDDHPFVLAAAYSKYTLAVTKRHEHEQRLTSIYDLFGPGEPTTSVDHFLSDAESVEDTDLIAWVSLGKEHLPRTEDVPLISSTLGVSFSLLPWNVFNGHAAMDIPREETPSGCSASL